MERDIREPYKIREKRSLPRESAPKRYIRAGASTPKRCKLVGNIHNSLYASPRTKNLMGKILLLSRK
jgi:hypothetical protein